RRHRFGPRQVLVGVLVVLAVLTPAAGLGLWSRGSASGEQDLRAAPTATVPAVARQMQGSVDRQRVLVLSADEGAVHAALLRSAGPRLTEPSVAAQVRRLEPVPGVVPGEARPKEPDVA